MQVTECESDDLRCGLPLQFVFRCIHRVGQRPNYFWKCIPDINSPTFSETTVEG